MCFYLVFLVLFIVGLDVTFKAFRRAVDEAADVAAMLLLEVVNLLVFVVELLELESAGALVTGELEFTHSRFFSKIKIAHFFNLKYYCFCILYVVFAVVFVVVVEKVTSL